MTESRNLVRHIGLIPDGGRRWAKLNRLPLREAYAVSMSKLESYLLSFFEYGIENVSIYLLSKQNLRRNPDELAAVYDAEQVFIESLVAQAKVSQTFHVRVAGNVDLLPDAMRQIVSPLEKRTDSTRCVFLCLAYDPWDELQRVLSSVIKQSPSESELLRLFSVDRPIDLVVRTGGAITLSNFLPFQCAYARLVFLEELFNDTSLAQIMRIVGEHENQDLKFGE